MKAASTGGPAPRNHRTAELCERLGVPELDWTTVISAETRVVEAGTREFTFGRTLAGRGHARYLALAATAGDDADLRHARDRHPELQGRIHGLADASDLLRNNAEVLILSDPAVEVPSRIHRHRYARTLLWSASGAGGDPRATDEFCEALTHGNLRSKLTVLGVSTLAGAGGRAARPVIVASILARKKETARHYISPQMGVAGFFETLEKRGIRYVVLRWFDTLPDLPPGEDVDLLVADQDVERVEEILDEKPGLIPCDLYSVSGLPRTAYRNMAYYPPPVAEKILARSEMSERGFRIPGDRDQFLSLAYHALYHKGETSGLPTTLSDVEPTDEPEHDYSGILADMADRLAIERPASMEQLDDYLAVEGWRPPMDTLGRLARKNRWIARRLNDLVGSGWEEYSGLTVFVIRQRAVEIECHEELIERIAAAGFRIVHSERLSGDRMRTVARNARGGNWSTGPWPTSGGPPAVVVVAFDPDPIEPDDAACDKHPGLENARVLIKGELRDLVNQRLAPEERCNVIHSSDNTWGAWEYLQLAVPEKLDEILAAIDSAHDPDASSKRPDAAGRRHQEPPA